MRRCAQMGPMGPAPADAASHDLLAGSVWECRALRSRIGHRRGRGVRRRGVVAPGHGARDRCRRRCGSSVSGVGATTTRTSSTGATGGTGAGSPRPRAPPWVPGNSSSMGSPRSPTPGSTASTSSTRRTCGSATNCRFTTSILATCCSSASPPSRRCWPSAGPALAGGACSSAPRTSAGTARRCSAASRAGRPAGHRSGRGGRSASRDAARPFVAERHVTVRCEGADGDRRHPVAPRGGRHRHEGRAPRRRGAPDCHRLRSRRRHRRRGHRPGPRCRTVVAAHPRGSTALPRASDRRRHRAGLGSSRFPDGRGRPRGRRLQPLGERRAASSAGARSGCPPTW